LLPITDINICLKNFCLALRAPSQPPGEVRLRRALEIEPSYLPSLLISVGKMNLSSILISQYLISFTSKVFIWRKMTNGINTQENKR
jgi:hypothetical protein